MPRVTLLLCMSVSLITLGRGNRQEPQCSKFHFEEKTLEKMIRLEMKFERLLEDIRASEVKLNEQKRLMSEERLKDKEELESSLDKMTHKINSNLEMMANTGKNVQDKLENKLKELENHPAVAFEAHKVTDISPRVGDTIVFSDTKLNEGGGYNNSTGVFTAPVGGVYLLMAKFCLQTAFDNILAYEVFHSVNYISSSLAKGATPLVNISVAMWSRIFYNRSLNNKKNLEGQKRGSSQRNKPNNASFGDMMASAMGPSYFHDSGNDVAYSFGCYRDGAGCSMSRSRENECITEIGRCIVREVNQNPIRKDCSRKG